MKVVKTYDALRAHRDEYIYFNTDHHWTQLGAYYAYVEFCKKKGIEPSDITTWEQHDYAPVPEVVLPGAGSSKPCPTPRHRVRVRAQGHQQHDVLEQVR